MEPNSEILQRLEQAERRLQESEQRLEQSERRGARAERRLRTLCCLTAAVLVGTVLLEFRSPASANEGGGLPALAQRVAALEFKTGPLKLVVPPGACPEVVFRGVNVRIINGMGNTETTNGCGNLIVGYNESRPAEVGPDVRTGSHNIIVGTGNNFSSFGGLVAWRFNASLANYASVSGGILNTASGEVASVSGGLANTAEGEDASVSGGAGNVALGLVASVSGGNSVTQNAPGGWSAGSEGEPISGSFSSP